MNNEPRVTHQPDTPFGCYETWGPYVAPPGRGLLSDLRQHTCNYNRPGHQHACRCKCGEERAAGVSDEH
jgi:hypothetical protein